MRRFQFILPALLFALVLSGDSTRAQTSTQFVPRHGTTAEHSLFIGADNELTVDSDKHTVVIHDGAVPGGHPLATEEALTDHLVDISNPHQVTAAQCGAVSTSASAGGDAEGFFSNLTVTRLRNQSVAATVPVTGQFLRYGGTAWEPSPVNLNEIDAAAAGINDDLIELRETERVSLNGSTSGTVTLKAPATVTSYDLVFPPDDGCVGCTLTTNGFGICSWSASAGGGDNISVNGSGVVDPNFETTGGDIAFVNTSNVITATLKSGTVGLAQMKNEDHGDVAYIGGAAVVQSAAANVMGPTQIDETANYAWTGNMNMTGGKPMIPSGTDAPATCTTGEMFLDTNGNTSGTTCVAAGNNRAKMCLCITTNSWEGAALN